jgi:hypothetical protein
VILYVILAIFAFFVLRALLGGSVGGVRTYDRLASGGLRGRALVLASSQIATGVTAVGRRFQRRTMTLDVELRGAGTFVVNGAFLVPRGLVEPIPGCSLEVAVDPKNRQNIAVLGPGGFTGPWLRTGPPALY